MQQGEEKEETCGCLKCLCKWLAATIFLFPWMSCAFFVALLVCASQALTHFEVVADAFNEVSHNTFDLDFALTGYTNVMIVLIIMNGVNVGVSIFGTFFTSQCQTHCDCLNESDGCRCCSAYAWSWMLNLWFVINWIINILLINQTVLATALGVFVLFGDAMCQASDMNITEMTNLLKHMIQTVNQEIPDADLNVEFDFVSQEAFCREMENVILDVGKMAGYCAAFCVIQTTFVAIARANYKEASMFAKYDMVILQQEKDEAEKYNMNNGVIANTAV